jgi:hypothetical protein
LILLVLFVFSSNYADCGSARQPRDNSDYETLLRSHSDLYPTSRADIEFTFPTVSDEEEELRLIFKWEPASMKKIKEFQDGDNYYLDPPSEPATAQTAPEAELLMFAIPHHQERLRPITESSNQILSAGCMPTIHGTACPVSVSPLFSVSFSFISFFLGNW